MNDIKKPNGKLWPDQGLRLRAFGDGCGPFLVGTARLMMSSSGKDRVSGSRPRLPTSSTLFTDPEDFFFAAVLRSDSSSGNLDVDLLGTCTKFDFPLTVTGILSKLKSSTGLTGGYPSIAAKFWRRSICVTLVGFSPSKTITEFPLTDIFWLSAKALAIRTAFHGALPGSNALAGTYEATSSNAKARAKFNLAKIAVPDLWASTDSRCSKLASNRWTISAFRVRPLSFAAVSIEFFNSSYRRIFIWGSARLIPEI